jgi:8-oxo-dGTP pyrophosphatase MutT (NUDIX family)
MAVMAREKLFFVGVKGLVENERGELLLLLADVSTFRKNTEPYWDIPGGRIKEGDSALETLTREIEEETGLKATGPQFITAVISNHEIPLDDGGSAGLVLMVYKVAVPATEKIEISEEHERYEWVDLASAKQRLQHKYPKEFTDRL